MDLEKEGRVKILRFVGLFASLAGLATVFLGNACWSLGLTHRDKWKRGVGGEDLCDLLQRGQRKRVRPQQLVCCYSAQGENGVLDLEEMRVKIYS